jgi:hypothetical protein
LRPSEEPAILLREDGAIRLRWSTVPGELPAQEFSLTYMADGSVVAAWRDSEQPFGLARKAVHPGEEDVVLSLSGMEDLVLHGIRGSERTIAIDPDLLKRIVRLEELVEESCETLDRNSLEHALLFLEHLGPTKCRPSAFVTHVGRFRMIWSTATGDPIQEQFAVSFTGTGEAVVVYSDPTAANEQSEKRHVGGGLVGVGIGAGEVIDLLASSGLERYVRDGILPGRGTDGQEGRAR